MISNKLKDKIIKTVNILKYSVDSRCKHFSFITDI